MSVGQQRDESQTGLAVGLKQHGQRKMLDTLKSNIDFDAVPLRQILS